MGTMLRQSKHIVQQLRHYLLLRPPIQNARLAQQLNTRNQTTGWSADRLKAAGKQYFAATVQDVLLTRSPRASLAEMIDDAAWLDESADLSQVRSDKPPLFEYIAALSKDQGLLTAHTWLAETVSAMLDERYRTPGILPHVALLNVCLGQPATVNKTMAPGSWSTSVSIDGMELGSGVSESEHESYVVAVRDALSKPDLLELLSHKWRATTVSSGQGSRVPLLGISQASLALEAERYGSMVADQPDKMDHETSSSSLPHSIASPGATSQFSLGPDSSDEIDLFDSDSWYKSRSGTR